MVVTFTNQLGKVDISDSALASISGSALSNCKGVAGLSTKKIADGITDMLGRENLSKGITINIEDNKVIIDVSVIIEYGVNIAAAAEEIISAINTQVDMLTGLQVSKVNVHVEGIKMDKQ